MPIQPPDLPDEPGDSDALASSPAESADDEHVTLIAEAADVPLEQDDVIALEPALPALQPAVAIYLFQPDVAPSLATLEELPELVSKERNFVWVDLTGYTPEEMRAVAHVVGLHRHRRAGGACSLAAPTFGPIR